MPRDHRDVDPRELRVPASRPVADPFKYVQQVRRFGGSTATMPPIIVYEGTDGHLLIYNGVRGPPALPPSPRARSSASR